MADVLKQDFDQLPTSRPERCHDEIGPHVASKVGARCRRSSCSRYRRYGMGDDDAAQFAPSARMSTFGRFHDVARRHLGLMKEALTTLPPEPPHPRYEDGLEREAWDFWDHTAAEIRERADE